MRNRTRSLLQNSAAAFKDRSLGEALWIGFEHEAMHLETFLYMLLQSEKALPPVGVECPDFVQIAQQAKHDAKPNQWFRIPKQTLEIGLDDSDETALPRHSFGWDNEKPQRTVMVHSFEAQARPITNGEYAKYLQASRLRTIPAAWILVNSDENYPISKNITRASPSATDEYLNNFAVRTVFGAVPLSLTQDWPLVASYDEVANYAKWVECRIPTFEEVKSIYHYADKLQANASHTSSNGHMHANIFYSRDGCNTTDSNATNGSNGHGMTNNIFRNLDGCNVGFKTWHPIPVTPNGDRLAGQGDFGGVWEWTSTPLMPHEGFQAMEIYPGYTCKRISLGVKQSHC